MQNKDRLEAGMRHFLISPKSMYIALTCLLCLHLLFEYFLYHFVFYRENELFLIYYLKTFPFLFLFYSFLFYKIWKDTQYYSVENKMKIRRKILRANRWFGLLLPLESSCPRSRSISRYSGP